MTITWIEKIKLVLRSASDLKPKIDIEKVTAETRFREDLGFDSLAMAAFFYELQDQYSFLDESDVVKWKSLGDCIQTLQSHK